jgi:predicted RNase H-like HicB family nuclease
MTLKYSYWKEDDWLLGYFDDFPEHVTQGKTVEELEFMLKDLYGLMELDKAAKPQNINKGELVIA